MKVSRSQKFFFLCALFTVKMSSGGKIEKYNDDMIIPEESELNNKDKNKGKGFGFLKMIFDSKEPYTDQFPLAFREIGPSWLTSLEELAFKGGMGRASVSGGGGNGDFAAENILFQDVALPFVPTVAFQNNVAKVEDVSWSGGGFVTFSPYFAVNDERKNGYSLSSRVVEASPENH